MIVTREEIQKFIVLCDFEECKEKPTFSKGGKRLKEILESWLEQRSLLEEFVAQQECPRKRIKRYGNQYEGGYKEIPCGFCLSCRVSALVAK